MAPTFDEAPEPLRDDPEPTAQPSERLPGEDQDEKIVPMSNVGGAAPTALGADSGGDLPGSEDDLENLAEPEPPDAPELGAIHVRLGRAEE